MRAIIKVQNCWSWLATDSPEVSHVLWKSLRFRARNYFHSRLYKQKLWDGFEDFFIKKDGRFLTGLLPEVEMALKYIGAEYIIQDERTFPKFVHNEVTPDFLEENNPTDKPFILEDYQCDLPNQFIKHKRGIITAPTSAGKTAIMMAILKCIHEKTPTLILANKTGLSSQNYEELTKWGFKNVGRLYDKYTEPNIVTCANVQSLHKIAKLLPYIRVLIVDEIHEMMSKERKKFYNKLNSASLRLAVSATPFKFDGKDKVQKYSVKGYFGPILKTTSSAAENGIVTTKKLQERGRLSTAECKFYPIREPDIQLQIYQDAKKNGISDNHFLHDKVKKLASTLTGRTLILVEHLEHGDTLHNMIPGSLWVQGKDDIETRKVVIEQLQKASGNVIAIATQGIFNTGINVFIHNLINAAGGQAEHQIIQRMGRGLRTAWDKVILHYYDFIFYINEYLEDHSWNRVKILTKEGHKVEVLDDFDF